MEICIELDANIPPGHADRQRALAALDGGSIVAHPPGNLTQTVGDFPEAALIVQGLGEDFRFTQVIVYPPDFSEWIEHTAQVEAEVNGLLTGEPALGEMRQGFHRLLKAGDSLPVRGTHARLGSGLLAVCRGLVPHLPP